MPNAKCRSTYLRTLRVPLLLGLFTAAMILVLELRHPYFFLQDDNRDYHLPLLVHNFRALQQGEIPLFNFHQYLGTPALACIESAALYPLNYLALLLSKILLGHPFGAVEFIALIHLVMASTGFYFLMRHFRLGESSCCFGAIAWAFSGFVVIVGDSWLQILGYAAYVPWIFLYSLRLFTAPTLKGFLILVALKVAVLLLGYPQLFVYTATFEALMIGLLALSGGRGRSKGDGGCGAVPPPCIAARSMAGTAGAFLLNYLCVTLAALPLLLPALHQVGISAGRQQVFSREEYSQFGYSFSQWLQGVLFPFADAPRAAWFEPQVISHVGLLTVIFLVVALIRAKNSPNLRFIVLFSLLALGAYSWAGNGIVTRLLYHLPLFGGFRWPFKLGFFVSFFMIAVATFGFDSFDTALKTAAPAPALLRRLAVPLLLALHAANFLFLHTVQPQHMFSRHHDRIPFDEPLKERLRDGRIVSIGPPIDMAGEKRIYGYSAPLLGFNYATLFGLYHFGGYEALVSAENARATMGLNERSLITVRPDLPLDMQRNLPLEYFREWGVKWYVIDSRVPLKPDDSLTLFHSDAIRNILFDRSARPLVYWVDRLDDAGITWGMTTNSMSASLESGSGGELAVNVLYNPFFTALLDGQPTEIRLANNRKMLVRIPAGSHRVSIRYRDPYFRYGVLVSLPFMLGLGLLYALHGRRSRHV